MEKSMKSNKEGVFNSSSFSTQGLTLLLHPMMEKTSKLPVIYQRLQVHLRESHTMGTIAGWDWGWYVREETWPFH